MPFYRLNSVVIPYPNNFTVFLADGEKFEKHFNDGGGKTSSSRKCFSSNFGSQNGRQAAFFVAFCKEP